MYNRYPFWQLAIMLVDSLELFSAMSTDISVKISDNFFYVASFVEHYPVCALACICSYHMLYC
jgi:hypothetical protein